MPVTTPREAGSALMLVPAAVLVLVVLAAVAVDSAVVVLAQREIANRAAAVANDAAGAALSDAGFYGSGAVEIDLGVARERLAAAFPTAPPPGFVSWQADVRLHPGRADTVVVEAWAEVRYVFARSLPGVRGTAVVRARSVATSMRG